VSYGADTRLYRNGTPRFGIRPRLSKYTGKGYSHRSG
jgi:hypothetical protein